MPLSLADMQVGATVCEMFDEHGKKLPYGRYGVINKILSKEVGGVEAEVSIPQSVSGLMVDFGEGKLERVLPMRLALHKQPNMTAVDGIKQRRANEVVLDMRDHREPLVVADFGGVKNQPPIDPSKLKKH